MKLDDEDILPIIDQEIMNPSTKKPRVLGRTGRGDDGDVQGERCD